jgi:pimeloyl-ACP methyl ester carboxylesterase
MADTPDSAVTTSRIPTVDGVELVVHEAGRRGDPVVVLCHGFPESAHSWRHQMAPLAAAGFHVIAPDQRGYAHSSAPGDVGAYRVDHLCADLLALLDHVGAADAVFVGHDWGAMVVWQMAQLHPDRTRAVAAVSVPFTAWPMPPTELMKAMYGDDFFYILYFQPVGPAEAELGRDVRRTMHSILWAASGAMWRGVPTERLPAEGTGFVDAMEQLAGPIPETLPGWLTQADLDTYVEQFTASGFFGPVSWYRNLDANHELTKDLGPGAVTMPSCFIGGTHDGVIASRPEFVEAMLGMLPDFRGAVMIEGAGHWTQQEAPEEFNEALLGFLRTL